MLRWEHPNRVLNFAPAFFWSEHQKVKRFRFSTLFFTPAESSAPLDANANSVRVVSKKDDIKRCETVCHILDHRNPVTENLPHASWLTDLATAIGENRRRVVAWLKDWDDNKNLYDCRANNCGVRKFGEGDLMAMFEKADEEPFWTWHELANWFCHEYHEDMRSISSWTLRFAIRRYGLNRRIAGFQKPLTTEHIAARLAFAQAHEHWTVERWKNVIFTDEKGVCGNGIIRRWVSRPVNSRHVDRYHGQETLRSARVNFYAYVTSLGMGDVAIFPANANALSVKEAILEAWLGIAIRTNNLPEEKIVLHDRAPFYNNAEVNAFLEERMQDWPGYVFLLLPAFSPDINIMENFFPSWKGSSKRKLAAITLYMASGSTRSNLFA